MNSKVKVAIGALVGGVLGFFVGCKVADKVYGDIGDLPEPTPITQEELKDVVNEFFNFDD